MPIYEFECPSCSTRMEVLFRKAGEKKRISCPHCQGKKMSRIFSSFNTRGGKGSSKCSTCSTKECSTCQ